MKKDRRCVNVTQNRDHTSRSSAASTSQMELEKESATQTARQAAACCRGIKESLQLPQCRRLLEDSPVSTSSTQESTQRCPVTGRPIPPLEEVAKKIEESLILSNRFWPRWIVVEGIAQALRNWALKVGIERAAKMGDIIFCSYQAEACPEEDEEFARIWNDATGGTLNGRLPWNNGDNSDGDDGNKLVLPGRGDAAEDGGTGRESRIEGPPRGDGAAGSVRSEEGGRVLAFRPGGLDREGLSRRLILLELENHLADLEAFQGAYSCIHRRVQDVKDEGQLMKLVEWSGTSAVMGSLEMSIHAIERVVEELRDLLRRIDDGVIYNIDED